MTPEELLQTIQELIDLGWIEIFDTGSDLRFELKRCLLCEGTGVLIGGYCTCKMGRDVEKASRRIRA